MKRARKKRALRPAILFRRTHDIEHPVHRAGRPMTYERREAYTTADEPTSVQMTRRDARSWAKSLGKRAIFVD